MKLDRSLMILTVGAAAGLLFSRTVQAQEFVPLGQGRVYGISADGRVIVGELGDLAVYWNAASGASTPFDPRGRQGYAAAASSDGRVIVGAARDSTGGSYPSPNYRAFRWSADAGIVDIGLAGSAHSRATAVSSDGSVVVGASGTPNGGGDMAFRWTEAGGTVALGLLSAGYTSVATGVSGDGSIVVGWGVVDLQGNAHAFRWTQAAGLVDLGTPENSLSGLAEGISADGSTIIGYARIANTQRAYSWTVGGGWTALQMLAGYSNSQASAVSADGSVIVGRMFTSTEQRAVRWDGTAVRTIEQWLVDSGFTTAIGFALTDATGVNADGTVIVGNSAQGPWLARSGSGLIPDLGAFDAGLAEAGSGFAAAVGSQARLGLADVQARAREAWQADTESGPCAWVSGDVAAFADELRAEQAHVGACARVGNAGIALGAGRMRARQDWSEGGKGRVDGRFIAATLSLPITPSFVGSLSLSHARFDADLRRQYLNGEGVDVSTARPDADVDSVEARVVWSIEPKALGARWSPYVAWDWARTNIDAYVESGGGFPAEYDELRDRSQRVRVGVAANRSWQRNTLQVSLEGVRRLDEHAGLLGGRVQGLYDFVVPIDSNSRDWVQLQMGTRTRVGQSGTLAFDVHTASAGDDARWAIGLAYRTAFD